MGLKVFEEGNLFLFLFFSSFV